MIALLDPRSTTWLFRLSLAQAKTVLLAFPRLEGLAQRGIIGPLGHLGRPVRHFLVAPLPRSFRIIGLHHRLHDGCGRGTGSGTGLVVLPDCQATQAAECRNQRSRARYYARQRCPEWAPIRALVRHKWSSCRWCWLLLDSARQPSPGLAFSYLKWKRVRTS